MTDPLPPSRAEALANSAELIVDEDLESEAEGDETPVSPARRRARGLLDWVVVIGVALLVAFLVRTFVLAHFVVDGHSMDTTLHDGDRVFVNKLSYRLHDPNRGDVVVLHELADVQDGQSRDLIKRVIALEGETLEVRNCVVLIDGAELVEPYLDPDVVTPGNCGGDYGPATVPEDHVFVMGDNRAGSQDSRSENVGPIDEDDIVGRAFVVFWPTSHWRWL
jgi:signal peptidase I